MSGTRTLVLGVTLLGVALVTCIVSPAKAGAHGATDRLAELLGDLPADQIPTGILIDRALPLSRLEDHDGSAKSPPSSLQAWRQMVHEISKGALVAPSWPTSEAVLERAKPLIRQGVVPIAIMAFR